MNSYKLNSLTLATFSIYIATFKAEGLTDVIKNMIQIIMLLIVLIYFLFHRKKIQFFNISLVLVTPILLSSLISYFDGIISIWNLVNSIFYMMCLVLFYQIISIWIRQGKYYEMINVLYSITLFYCILSIISILIIGTTKSATTMYLFGGKFTTCYYFLMLLGFAHAKNQNRSSNITVRKIYFLCLVAMTLSVELYLQGTTAILITILFCILLIVPKNIRNILSNKKTVVSLVVASGMILFVMEAVLSNSFVSKFIVQYLGKSITLTDRMPIYSTYLFPLIVKRPIWGYGFSSSILHVSTPYWNAQNGLFETMLNYGALGCIALLIVVYKSAGNKNRSTLGWSYYAVLYALVLAGTIEISFSYIFYIMLFILHQTKNIDQLKKA